MMLRVTASPVTSTRNTRNIFELFFYIRSGVQPLREIGMTQRSQDSMRTKQEKTST
jgi:hypothetical protein